MASDNTIAALNRIACVLNRSLPMYLRDAKPYVRPEDAEAAEVLESIADEQRDMVARIGELVVEEGSQLDTVGFPITYTSLHDLSLDYLIGQLVMQQERDVQEIQHCVSQLSLAPRARALAEESLGAAKGHLETLRELGQPADADS